MVVFIFSFRAQKLLGSGMRKERKKKESRNIYEKESI